VLTAGTVWGDEVVEVELGSSDMLFRNDGMSDAPFTMVVDSPMPQPVAFATA